MKMTVLIMLLGLAVAVVGALRGDGAVVMVGAAAIVLPVLLASMRPPWEGP